MKHHQIVLGMKAKLSEESNFNEFQSLLGLEYDENFDKLIYFQEQKDLGFLYFCKECQEYEYRFYLKDTQNTPTIRYCLQRDKLNIFLKNYFIQEKGFFPTFIHRDYKIEE